MALRSIRERAVQTLSYEAGGFLVAMPLYALIAGNDASQSSLLVIAVAIACMAWSPLHNTLFDWAEWRLVRRLASDRPHRWRVVHAMSHEVSSVVVTNPIIMLVGGYSFWHALIVDIGLTLLYSVYAYFFHMGYDRLRPISVTHISRSPSAPEPGTDTVMIQIDSDALEPMPPIEGRHTPKRLRARRPARWAPQIIPHAAIALIQARRDDSTLNGF